MALKYFRYDGGDSFQELASNTGNIQTEFVRGSGMGGGIGSILYRASAPQSSNPDLEFFTYNAVGHTVALTSEDPPIIAAAPGGGSGPEVVKSDLYEAFGKTVASSGSSSNNRLANTKERSFTLGLDNHGFRYYDPEVGRYITRDPIGYGDGLNVYLYVHNNPINRVDPLGLEGILDNPGGLERRIKELVDQGYDEDEALSIVIQSDRMRRTEPLRTRKARALGTGLKFVDEAMDTPGGQALTGMIPGPGEWEYLLIATDQKQKTPIRIVAGVMIVVGIVSDAPTRMPRQRMGPIAVNVGSNWFDDVARNATRNADSDKLVLGHFSREGVSYQKVAAHYNATYFKVDDWNAVTKGLSQDEIWRINEAFLIQQVRQGKQILFSHNPMKARAGSFFEREVNFLKDLGYTFKQKNQWTWEAVK